MQRRVVVFTISLIVCVLFGQSLYSVAGRGGSYRSGSDSSGSSGGSGGSTGSGSAMPGISDDEPEYSGPYYTDEFNYKEYNTWLTIQNDGSAHVREELHMENPDSNYLSHYVSSLYNDIQIVPGSVKVSGDVAGNNEFYIELSPVDKPVKLVILEYKLINPFYVFGENVRFVWHSRPNGEVKEGYFQIGFEKNVKPSSLNIRFGAIGSVWGIYQDELNIKQLQNKNEYTAYYYDKKKYVSFAVDIVLPKTAISGALEDPAGKAVFYTGKASYDITINENEEAVFTNTYEAKRLKPGGAKIWPLPFFILKRAPDDAMAEEARSPVVIFKPESENLDFDDGGFLLLNSFDSGSLSGGPQAGQTGFEKAVVRYKANGLFEKYNGKKYIVLVLPALGSDDSLYSLESFTQTADVTIHLPGKTEANWKAYYGNDGYLRNFGYLEELHPKSSLSNGALHLEFDKPILGEGRILIELEIPADITAPASRLPYYFDFSTSAPKTWFYWVLGLLGFTALCAGVFAVMFYEPKHSNWDEAKEAANLLKKKYGGRSNRIEKTLQSKDPGFRIKGFKEHAAKTARILQNAWSENNMMQARSFVSQGIINRFRLQIKMMLEFEKLRNITVDYKAVQIVPLELDRQGQYDTIHLLFFEKARDITLESKVLLKDALLKAKQAPNIKFAQIYSFSRKQGAKTGKKNLSNDHCPACGGPIKKEGQTNICPYCSARYNSGEYDWVLTEITQVVEWENRITQNGPNIEEYSHYGDFQALEDRASYLFWEWLYAQSAGKREYMDRHATANFMKEFSPRQTTYYEPAVGSVETVSVGEIDDRFLVSAFKINWSASLSKNSEPSHRVTRMKAVLDKNTFPDSGFADEGCPACGAPTWDETSKVCKYCSSKLPPVSYDWLLHKIG